MTLSTKVHVEHPDLALVPTIRSLPDVEIGVVPDAGTDPDHDAHLFWFETADIDAIESALAEDHTVDDFAPISTSESRQTYRITYSERAKLISPAIIELQGLIIESRSHAKGWLLHSWFPDHSKLDQLNEYASEAGIRLDVLEVYQSTMGSRAGLDLTESQITALVSAYEHGYYDEPRQTDLAELGSVLSISETAVSGRLRRASGRLIAETLIDTDEQ
ncbi:bacterio-opsin activator [Halobacteriales archaeon QH_2_65_14]|nr:MAG: bacterio-opsin activator [Halobacteriales archaeon QH_2_65_14]